MFLFIPFLIGASPQEDAFRAEGCHFAAWNANGTRHFECCGTNPGIEVLVAYEESWDQPVDPGPCIPDGSCSAEEPPCDTITNGTDNCGDPCSKVGEVCPPDPQPPTFPITIAANSFENNVGWVESDGWMSTPNGSVNLGVEIVDAPVLSYIVTSPETGNFYIWIRGEGPDASSDSVNYGVNGQRTATITFLGLPWSNFTQYTVTTARIGLAAGENVLNLWMREDGTAIYEIRITDDPNYSPDG